MFAACKLFRLFAKQKLFGKLFGKSVEKCLLLANHLDCLPNRKLFGKLFGKPVEKCLLLALLLANYLDCLPNRNCLANYLANPWGRGGLGH